jgi:hypothetical protein
MMTAGARALVGSRVCKLARGMHPFFAMLRLAPLSALLLSLALLASSGCFIASDDDDLNPDLSPLAGHWQLTLSRAAIPAHCAGLPTPVSLDFEAVTNADHRGLELHLPAGDPRSFDSFPPDTDIGNGARGWLSFTLHDDWGVLDDGIPVQPDTMYSLELLDDGSVSGTAKAYVPFDGTIRSGSCDMRFTVTGQLTRE